MYVAGDRFYPETNSVIVSTGAHPINPFAP
jgi:hypothetical protein